jgi:predicted metalloprotease with PDZ domain
MIQYRLNFEQYAQHLIEVSVTFVAQPQQRLWLPTWIPGSYLIREFARHVGQVSTINTQTTQPIPTQKISKNQWLIACDAPTEVTVSYQVYAYDLSVRGAYVDHTRLYVNPACVCLAVAGQEQQVIGLTLEVGAAFAGLPIATTLAQRAGQPDAHVIELVSTSYTHLIDHPFEVASHSEAHFEVAGISHRVAISGRHQTDLLRLSQDLQRICQYQIDFFGHAPFSQYLFMVMATGNSYGGLEHLDCTSLITPRDDLPRVGEGKQPSLSYRRFLGLCSHEYLHAWLVKSIRPAGFREPNLHQEVYTRLLWVFEGFTSYYDDLMLYRSGVIDQSVYLELLSEQITRYFQNAGRAQQSVSDSSFDAWIKYYRPDENTSNAGTSYYNKGALVALCLDLTLRQYGQSLDVVLKALYEQSKTHAVVDDATLPQLCLALTGVDFAPFFDQYVNGTVELPLESLLTNVGVELILDDKAWPFGMKYSEQPQGVLVQHVLRDGMAARAGVSAQDVIVAIDGLKASAALLNQYAERGLDHAKPLHVFRRDELHQFSIKGGRSLMPSSRLSIVDPILLKGWL